MMKKTNQIIKKNFNLKITKKRKAEIIKISKRLTDPKKEKNFIDYLDYLRDK